MLTWWVRLQKLSRGGGCAVLRDVLLRVMGVLGC